ncbi:hypothetical protein MTO96_033052 [Rhipicephalus appendiculatus]
MESRSGEGSRASLSELSRRWSSARSEQEPDRHSSGLLGYLMPFYLFPVLYPGTKMDVLTAVLLLLLVLAGDDTVTVGPAKLRAGRPIRRARTAHAGHPYDRHVPGLAGAATESGRRACYVPRGAGLQLRARVDTLLLYEELAVALWKRHRAGLEDPDPVECWVASDANRHNAKGDLRRKASILKQPKRIIKKVVRRVSLLTGTEDATPSGPRFADVPAEQALPPPQAEQPENKEAENKEPDVEEVQKKHRKVKHPAGRKLRTKVFGTRSHRRQSFADKAHVFEDTDRFHVPQDQRHDAPPSAPHLLDASTKRSSVPRLQASGSPVTVGAGPAAAGVVIAFGSPSRRSSQGSMAGGVRVSISSLDSQAKRSQRSQHRVSLAVASASPEPDTVGGRGSSSGRQPRILFRHQNQVVLPGSGSPKRAGQFQREPGYDQAHLEEQRLQRDQDVLAALCVCGSMTSVAGSIASYWFMPGAEAIAANMDSSSLSFWSWTLITLPVSLAASALSSVCVYYGSLYAYDSQLNAQAEKIICCYARLRLNRLEKCRFFELLNILFWIGYSGTILGCRFMQRQDLITCFLGVIVLFASALSMLPRTGMNRAPQTSAAQFRVKVDVDGDETPDFRPDPSQCFASLTSRLPWGVIVAYGAASVITRIAETTGLAKVAFNNQFWSRQSDLAKQVLLTVASSLMAEFMTAAALCNAILPIVINLSTDTEHDALYFGLPVAVGASVNTILPVSLPLVMLHDMAPVTRKQLILTGAFVKTVVVASILLSMNTTGEYVLHSTKQFNATETVKPA